MTRLAQTFHQLIATLWTDAAPEQQKITTQLARNAAYFAAAALLIRHFGEQLAV